MLININRNLFQNFPFHLVTISPWPILVSFSLLSLTLGAVLSMHGYSNFTFLLGLSSTGLGILLWFRDIILEATYLGDHTTQVQKGLTIGVILFIVSEVFAFLSVFWAFFHSSLSPSVEIGGIWPPQGIEAFGLFNVTIEPELLSLFILTVQSPQIFTVTGNKKFLHSSKVLYSAPNVVKNAINTTLQQEAGNPNRALVKISKNTALDNLKDEGQTTMIEDFPWFYESDGTPINYNAQIKVFDGVKLISRYLEVRYNLKPELIADIKISELLAIFENKGESITVLDVYNHVTKVLKSDPEFFHKTKEIFADSSHADTLKESEEYKILGTYGDISLNAWLMKLWNQQWETVFQGAKITIHIAPTAINLISYGFMLKAYMRYIHNREYPKNISPTLLNTHKKARLRNLAIFSIIGAPLGLALLKTTAIPLSEMFSITSPPLSFNKPLLDDSSNTQNNGLFLLLSKISQFTPKWLSYSIKLILIVLLVLKLIGLNLLNIYSNLIYLEIFSYITCTLAIIFQCVNLFFLNKFSNKEYKVSSILPDFIIKWLNEFKDLSINPESMNAFKSTCYIQICIYIFIIVLTRLILS